MMIAANKLADDLLGLLMSNYGFCVRGKDKEKDGKICISNKRGN
jgi:hypothetical protein